MLSIRLNGYGEVGAMGGIWVVQGLDMDEMRMRVIRWGKNQLTPRM